MFTRISKSIVILLITFLCFSNTNASELRIAITEYPPHVNVVNGKLNGPILQYLKGMFDTSFDKITFVIVPSRRGVLELQKGTVDMLFPFEQLNKGGETLGEPILNVVFIQLSTRLNIAR